MLTPFAASLGKITHTACMQYYINVLILPTPQSYKTLSWAIIRKHGCFIAILVGFVESLWCGGDNNIIAILLLRVADHT